MRRLSRTGRRKLGTLLGDLAAPQPLSWTWYGPQTHPPGLVLTSSPVCTTELSAVASNAKAFAARGVKLLGLSANDVESHHGWIKDIDAINTTGDHVEFPIVADKSRKISELYGMLDHQDVTNVDAKGMPFTVRSVFIIDPARVIRLTVTYPASVGRNFDELIRVVDALQLGDKHKITTPASE
jgi:alkyl hydroperoxide reductase subunit AhpC